jgi:hypothetical protein
MCYEWFDMRSSLVERLRRRRKDETLKAANKSVARKAEVAKPEPIRQAEKREERQREPDLV